MTNHGLQLKPWQLGASVLILPMVPQPHMDAHGWWHWTPSKSILGFMWKQNETPGPKLYRRLKYKAGDRIYNQEEWHDTEPPFLRSEMECALNHVGLTIENEAKYGFLSPGKMPPEAANKWWKITKVEVTQSLNAALIKRTGIPFEQYDNPMSPCDEIRMMNAFASHALDCYEVDLENSPWMMVLNIVPCTSPFKEQNRGASND